MTVFLHGCFGFVNVVLLLTTRQTLLLFDDPRSPRRLRFRRAAGGALADWDDEARVGGTGNVKARNATRRYSSRGEIVGRRRAASMDSINDLTNYET